MYNGIVIFLLLTVFKDEIILSLFSIEKPNSEQNFRHKQLGSIAVPHLLKAGGIYLCRKFLDE
jgi:hypothetical protein